MESTYIVPRIIASLVFTSTPNIDASNVPPEQGIYHLRKSHAGIFFPFSVILIKPVSVLN